MNKNWLPKTAKTSVLALALLISACAGTPTTNFYQLTATGDSNSSQAVAIKRRFGVGPLMLPTLLQREQIVTRSDDHNIHIAEFQHWAEPLQEAMLQVITQNLTRLQPESAFNSYPWSAYGQVDYKIIIEIIRFDAELGKAAYLDATWSVMNEASHEIINNKRISLSRRLTTDAYSELVAADSWLLKQFSEQLSAYIEGINR